MQGVGFRPFVYRIALENSISGSVCNTPVGVHITATGRQSKLDNFLEQLRADAPPLAVIDEVDVHATETTSSEGFAILQSEQVETTEAILPPDVTICSDCDHEIQDPNNRRYQYPLNNCTNCGPRYTIIRSLPYDRPATSMSPFPLCHSCQQEYENPSNRRFHAEATSCPECGPKMMLSTVEGEAIVTESPIIWIAKKIEQGCVVAIQGVGGFHIICDALNASAVTELRCRKNRPTKPFAVMVKDVDMAERYGVFDVSSRNLIQSHQRPIVIVQDKGACCAEVTKGLDRIGLFLPYTPLLQLLFNQLDRPIIATSANISDEPIITDSTTLKNRLGSVIEYVLEFNRDIVNGCDDSVINSAGDVSIMIRRARGYAPANFNLPESLDKRVLAVGADQKNTIGLGLNSQAILSPHVGDLQTLGAKAYYQQTIETFFNLYKFTPDIIVCDKHPNYTTSHWAHQQSAPVISVQHHYAHALSGMVASGMGIDSEILSICWDGTGYGDDGTIWGGEFLTTSYRGYRRVAHLKPFPLLGGEKAVKEPRRVAIGLLFDLLGEDAIQTSNPCTTSWEQEDRALLWAMYRQKINSPKTSSIGRLFDAAASLLGLYQVLSFEGESGLMMEKYFDPDLDICYKFNVDNGLIDCSDAILAMSMENNQVRGVTAFVNMLVNIICCIMDAEGRKEALLCGGVFQNSCLVERLFFIAPKRGYTFYLPPKIPCNDGGISLGQLAYALRHDQ